MPPNHWRSAPKHPAFSLVEMAAVIGLLVMLSVAGFSVLHGTADKSRAAGLNLLAGLVEQARAAAIASRSHVVLAVAAPGDLVSGDERCRLGLFHLDSWPDASSLTVNGVLMSRWHPMDTGVVLLGGQVDGLDNPMDAATLTISDGATVPRQFTVHALVFDPRGGLVYPVGSMPVAMRVAEGGYRGGQPVPCQRNTAGRVSESRLKIGRLTAYSYRLD